uniref:ubiquitinyl hydrolase 1 n=1 Tax=Astyanax mexicanus TaxID=7994 RepID=W5L5D8_ASTMX
MPLCLFKRKTRGCSKHPVSATTILTFMCKFSRTQLAPLQRVCKCKQLLWVVAWRETGRFEMFCLNQTENRPAFSPLAQLTTPRTANKMEESRLVSNKEALSAEILEPSEETKYQDFCQQFGFIRRVKGDGNCFYRALCFRLVETLMHNGSSVRRIKDQLLRSNEDLVRAGVEEGEFKELIGTFLRVLDQLEADDCEETLLGFFNDHTTSDSMVKYLRLLTSAHLQNHADFFQHFLEAPNLKAYCTQEVEAMAMECDHVEILALSEALDISLCIISMDSSDGHLVYHTIPEGSECSIYLLYKTSHYDILYKHREH